MGAVVGVPSLICAMSSGNASSADLSKSCISALTETVPSISRFSIFSKDHANSPIRIAPISLPLPFSVWYERRMVASDSLSSELPNHTGSCSWMLASSSSNSSMKISRISSSTSSPMIARPSSSSTATTGAATSTLASASASTSASTSAPTSPPNSASTPAIELSTSTTPASSASASSRLDKVSFASCSSTFDRVTGSP